MNRKSGEHAAIPGIMQPKLVMVGLAGQFEESFAIVWDFFVPCTIQTCQSVNQIRTFLALGLGFYSTASVACRTMVEPLVITHRTRIIGPDMYRLCLT